MKKAFQSVTLGFLLLLFSTACTQDSPQTENDNPISILMEIAINSEEELLVNEELQVEKNSILLDVLKNQYDVEVTNDGFITSIEGYEQNPEENLYWMYEVNNEMPNVGANEYQLEDDDHVIFELQTVN
ncbi:DUF4430 domain-containing protein [Gracilibacillus sp. YIM 98692]|uniref:DUF4430 domain-containing protein n=1 Tax=Gracilibacillus sp. YIM 98692 TaxID=2663532 RepID=UPI001969E377|nr:DUF4430 domain-containing protein [Gracilibacillus sp. YIM 98692]